MTSIIYRRRHGNIQNQQVSHRDLHFLLELNHSKTGEIASYEMAEMYGIRLDELEELVGKMNRQQQNEYYYESRSRRCYHLKL
jgi:hypothetical protein